MRRAVAVAVVLIGMAACSDVGRVANTTEACTAALDLRERMANAEAEEPAIQDFVDAALDSENEDLVAIAEEARRANEEGDMAAVEEAIESAREECEEEGGA